MSAKTDVTQKLWPLAEHKQLRHMARDRPELVAAISRYFKTADRPKFVAHFAAVKTALETAWADGSLATIIKEETTAKAAADVARYGPWLDRPTETLPTHEEALDDMYDDEQDGETVDYTLIEGIDYE